MHSNVKLNFPSFILHQIPEIRPQTGENSLAKKAAAVQILLI